ncbi:MAG TPA: glycosyltransferase, partial [Solirubrobacteraceae bacterium]|nr:glycosyltransferase [Solirubrobacteraceae bacterium]
ARALGDRVELAGAAPDLGAELAKASVFVLSSRREGYPLVLLEAMSKGLAVAAFDCPTGPRDIVVDRENGMIVPPKDPEAFAEGLLALIEDEELRRRCGAAAAVTARDYTIEAIGPRWEALFRELA